MRFDQPFMHFLTLIQEAQEGHPLHGQASGRQDELRRRGASPQKRIRLRLCGGAGPEARLPKPLPGGQRRPITRELQSRAAGGGLGAAPARAPTAQRWEECVGGEETFGVAAAM